ncbi:MAG TPA: AGE family epimerase/isomerase [Prolixibacteraceae bacterium]|nr:AGE family epimerase/isomerase [Prolixibacteraceae bacterium]
MKRAVSEFIGVLEKELRSLLKFWEDHAVDDTNGGFIGQILSSGLRVKDATKGAILNGRILWSFSAASLYFQDQKYRALADRAYQYIVDYFIDKKYGGVYWELDAKGNPVNRRKQAYALGFALYGLSEYYRASGNEKSLLLAQELFWTLEKNFSDKKYGGYIEALGENWHPLSDMRLSERDANFPKSMNTHLHILEPYTNLYRCWKNPILAERIRHLIRIFLDRILHPETDHFQLFFEMDWTVRSEIVSFGHDIEGAWLLTEAAEALGDKTLLAEVQAKAVRMTDTTHREGSDSDGSLFYERNGEHLDTDKHWWPQAEAMVGFVNAWEITGKQFYLDAAEKVWDFIDKRIIDHSLGEWYWRVDAEGLPYSDDEKAGFWKCPYHNSRALMELARRLK